MQYRSLGSSLLRVSETGFGCMSLGEDERASTALINYALDKGINFFDTADLYQQGRNEAMVGKALQQKRADVIIATKVGNQWRADGSGWDWNPRKDYILNAVNDSLRRLQTDYIDLYQLHGGTLEDPIDETIEAFEQLQQQGKIRYYGISSIRPNVIREYVKRSNIVSVMMQYSLLDRRPEETCLPLLQQEGIGVLARGSLAKGLLINKPAAPYLNYREADVARAAEAVRRISGPGRNAAQTAVQFVLQHPAVCCAVTGIRTAEQLEEITGTAARSLTEEEFHGLQQVLPVNYYDAHR
ncbi:MAG TPA: aldo/keto reductase [Chitinophagaceae bacterium]|jgi:aryl-alcohol dehydrogenase-like predicted oxidoreductase